MTEEYHGYRCGEPRVKPLNFQIRDRDADHSRVTFSVFLCCDPIPSCRFKTASTFSSPLFIITFTQFQTTPESVRHLLLKLMCVRSVTRKINLRERFGSNIPIVNVL